MPSPFPGMDPFLEQADRFSDLHDSLITYLREALQPRLPRTYFAALGSRVWVEFAQPTVTPDVNVLRRPESRPEPDPANGGVAVLPAVRSRPVLVRVPRDEVRQPLVEIFAREGPRLITTIEVLSPSNKTPGETARGLYLRKQEEVRASQVHLIEIDLLRGGQHTTAVPHDWAVARTGPFDYHVCIHPFDQVEDYFVYPVRLEESLPEILVPLLPGAVPVPLDLQAVFNRCYDVGAFHYRIDYAGPVPPPPLRPEQEVWIRQRLREQGLLPPEASGGGPPAP
jgi:hypothetical protein